MKQGISSDRVAVYIRWSTEDQGQGHTLEIQRESCRYYCLSQGWLCQDRLTFIDDGHSGSHLERPALARLREAVRAGQVECVVVYKLDRLSRNIRDIINLVLDEWEGRCSVRSTQEPVDTTSDAGRMFFTMLGSFADFERSTIRTRTWSGKRKNAEKGRNPGMAYPYGFQKGEAAGWEVIPAEAAVVRRIFDEYIRGRSCRLIAFDLNAEGHRTRSGKLWANADISRLLRNPAYDGRLVYNRRSYAQKRKRGQVVENAPEEVITVEGALPPILAPGVWAQAERVRVGRPRFDRGAPARTHSSPYLLSGLLRCPCGHAWVGIQGGKGNQRFYACAGARSAGPARCASRLIKAETLESFVLERVRLTWPVKGPFEEALFASLAEQQQVAESLAADLRRRLQALEGSLERFKQDYKTGKLPADVYMELTQETRAEREETARQLERAEASRAESLTARFDVKQAADLYAQLDAWALLTLTERQQILRMLIDHAVVSRPKGAQDVTMHIHWRLPAPA